MKITDLSLKYKTAVFVLLFLIVVGGFAAYINLPIESFPDITQPVVFVSVSYLGVAPADMETLVVQPLEDKLQEITNIKNLTSTSSEGFSSIIVEFEPDMEIDEAVRKVREKVDQARPEMPEDINEPMVQEINFENIPIMIISIVGDQPLELLKKTAEDLQEKIEEINGVLSVNISGGLDREVKVNVLPSRLIHNNLGIEDVISAIQNENITIPGGTVESDALKWNVRIPGEYTSIDDLRNTVVKARNGQPIYLRDLAEIQFGYKEANSYSRLNGRPSVTLSVQKRSGENIIRITDEVKAIFVEESSDFPSRTSYSIVVDFSEDIRLLVDDLQNNIIAGLLLVILVLYFFMGGRNGLLVGLAIPLSMLISFIVLSLLGYTLNFIVLYSLILSLGMLVDNSIVIVENIYRQHREGKDLLRAAREATSEVGAAVIVSTLTTLLAFLPLLFWQGIIGEFMKFLPITLIITLSSSLFVALVINPVMAASFLKVSKRTKELPGDRILRRLNIHYEKVLRWALRTKPHRFVSLLFTGLAFIGMMGIFIVFNHGMEFFPELEPSQFIVEVEAPLGSRLEYSDKIVREIERRINSTTDMEDYVADVGTVSNFFNFGGSGGGSSNRSQVTIDLIDLKDRTQPSLSTLERVTQSMKNIPGARIDVTLPQNGPPTGKPVKIQIKGEDFSTLIAISDEIMEKIEDVPGIARLKSDFETGSPELRIQVDREKAALQGLNTFHIANTIRTAVNGTKASEFRVDTDEYDIVVRYGKDYRKNYNDLLNLTIFNEGVHHPLANFVTLNLTTGLSNVNHVDGERVVTITADAIGRSAAEVLAETKRRLEDYDMRAGYTISFSGQDEEQRSSMQFLIRALMIAVVLIFFVLVAKFNSITLPVVIMVTVVLSFIGVFIGLLVTFKPFSIIMTGIGVISLAGIVVNNAIVLIDYIQKLRARNIDKIQAIIQAGKTRMRPVLLTAITTILGLLPLTIGITIDFIGLFTGDIGNFIQFGAESSQFWSGMGVVVIFGLAFSTFLTLLVVPVLYYILSDFLSDLAGKLGLKRKSES